MSAIATPLAPLDQGRAGFRQSLVAEWTKFRSVRSTWVSLSILIVAAIGLAALVTALQANHWKTGTLQDRFNFDPLRYSQAGHFVNQFVVGVLGVLIVSAEYTTGSIRTTLAATPRRLTVLLAKGTVLTAILFLLSEAVAFISFLLSEAILKGAGGMLLAPGTTIRGQISAAHAPYLTLSSPGAAAALFRSGLFLVLLALVAFGIAWIIRNTTGSISLFVGILLVLPLILQLLPSSFAQPIERYLPINLGTAMVATSTRHNDFAGTLLSPWAASAVMLLYALILVGIGAWMLNRRDA